LVITLYVISVIRSAGDEESGVGSRREMLVARTQMNRNYRVA